MPQKVAAPQQPKISPRRIANNTGKGAVNHDVKKKGNLKNPLEEIKYKVSGKLNALIDRYKSNPKGSVTDKKAFLLSILNVEPFQELRQLECLIQEQEKKAELLRLAPPKLSKAEIRLNSTRERAEQLKAELEEIEKENVELRQKKLSNNVLKRKVGSVKLTKLRNRVQRMMEVNDGLEQRLECINRRIQLMTHQKASLREEICQIVEPQPLAISSTPILSPFDTTNMKYSLISCCSFTIE